MRKMNKNLLLVKLGEKKPEISKEQKENTKNFGKIDKNINEQNDAGAEQNDI